METTEEIAIFSSDTGNETEAVEGYIRNVLPHRIIFRAARLSGYRLPEPSLSLYKALRTRVSNVAAGKDGDTAFAISYGDVFQNTFTAEELGVNDIIIDGSITQEAKDAAMATMKQNRSEIRVTEAVLCLIADSPYELYWYDKSEGHGTKVSYTTSKYSANQTTITVQGTINVKMSVSRDYAVQAGTLDGEITYEEYTADTRYGASAQAAAENAAVIIAENRNKSDEEKMAAYRDAICALAEYNYEATESVPYGDPWQLVWVFDGKPNTKVVCEGYAKAFQYLCEMGTTEATAISIQGQTNGSHMWNIVAIGGHNYLVDLTNYDLGYDLYMKGYSDGDVSSGYYIRHNRGTMKYTYNPGQTWSEADLTLYPMDYSEWKSKVEKAPEVQVSSGVVYPGYAAAVRIVNEDPEFEPSEIRVHQTAGDEEETSVLEYENGYGFIDEAGEYWFTVVRDGVESSASEPVVILVETMPEEGVFRLPNGVTIETEAFAGSGMAVALLMGDYTIKPGAFDDTTVLCVDQLTEWIEGYQFEVKK